MLFACLQGQRESFLAVEVGGTPNDAPRQLAHEFLLAGKDAEVWTARRQRNPKRLAVATDNIGTGRSPFARRLQRCERQRIDDADDQRTLRMRPVGQRVDVLEHAEEIGLRNRQRSERTEVLCSEPVRRDTAAMFAVVAEIEFNDIDVLQLDDRAQGLAVGRMHTARHQYSTRPLLRAALGHQHRFGERGRTVVH